MKFGKLTSDELLKSVLKYTSKNRKEVVLSAAAGEDCAALDIDDFIVLSCDPITTAVSNKMLGKLAINVALNDIICAGGEPIAVMITLLMPQSCVSSDVAEIMESASLEAQKANADIIGGHTEFTDSVTRPVLSAFAVGKAARIIKKTDIKVGDDVFITKFPALEGTVILSEHKNANLTLSEQKSAELLKNDLNVIKEGKILKNYDAVTSMHDITEGGLLGSAAEICLAAGGIGIEIYSDKIPMLPLTTKLCEKFNLNPLKLISSGALMFTGVESQLNFAIAELKKSNIQVTKIGKITSVSGAFLVDTSGQKTELAVEPDEIYKI